MRTKVITMTGVVRTVSLAWRAGELRASERAQPQQMRPNNGRMCAIPFAVGGELGALRTGKRKKREKQRLAPVD